MLNLEEAWLFYLMSENPFKHRDTLFMTEWVAIFRESGLRDDASVENLREATCSLCTS